MASDICEHLINEPWSSYKDDLPKVPEAEGIYTIGARKGNGEVRYLYVGHSIHLRTRLRQHKYQNLRIDKFLKEEFKKDGGKGLRMKWVRKKNSKRKEGVYINCMEKKLKYRLKYNIKRGNKSSPNRKEGNLCESFLMVLQK